MREAAFSDLKPVWKTAVTPVGGGVPSLGSTGLAPEDYQLIDSFLGRRSQLDFDVRIRMADQIFLRLKPRLTLLAESTPSAESILEALAHERRVTGSYD